MALFVEGMACPLCGRPIVEDDAKASMPPFIRNLADPLAAFSDAVFHQQCFQGHELHEAVLIRAEAEARFASQPHSCAACGDLIAPGDSFAVGHLTDDPNDPLHEFNYVTLHRSHLETWSRYPEFERLVAAFQNSPRYRAYDPILSSKPHRAPGGRVGRTYPLR